jgi:hypothetical protein
MKQNKEFTIPECAKVTNISIQDNLITVVYEEFEPTEVDFEPEQFIPKDGDFCTLKVGGRIWYLIFKSQCNGEIPCHAMTILKSLYFDDILFHDSSECLTLSTEAEKQTLLSEIDKAGFVWNADKKRIEKKMWRAEKNGEYFILSPMLKPDKANEDNYSVDRDRHAYGDYFQTEQQATEAAELVRGVLYHFHQDDKVLTKIKELLR